jgi:hypothetical protein
VLRIAILLVMIIGRCRARLYIAHGGFQGLIVILPFFNHFINKEKRFVSITNSKVRISKLSVCFRKLEAMDDTIWYVVSLFLKRTKLRELAG